MRTIDGDRHEHPIAIGHRNPTVRLGSVSGGPRRCIDNGRGYRHRSRRCAVTCRVHRAQRDAVGRPIGQPTDGDRRGRTRRISPRLTIVSRVLILRDRRTTIRTRSERDLRRPITRASRQRGRRSRNRRRADDVRTRSGETPRSESDRRTTTFSAAGDCFHHRIPRRTLWDRRQSAPCTAGFRERNGALSGVVRTGGAHSDTLSSGHARHPAQRRARVRLPFSGESSC